MLIQTMKLRHFRSYRVADLIFGEKNLIVGPHGSGKSTIIDAICYAMDGTCRGTDEGGRNAEKLRWFFWHAEEQQAAPLPGGVEITLQNGIYRRGIGDGPNSKTGQEIAGRLAVRRDAIRAVFRPGTFLDRSMSEQTELWAALSAPPDITPVAKQHLKDLMPEKEIPSTLKQVDALLARLTQYRPELKRAIQEVDRKTQIDLTSFNQRLVPLEVQQLRETQERLKKTVADLQAERDALLVASGAPPPAPVAQAPLPLDGKSRTVRDLEDMLKPFPGQKRGCPHCGKAITLIEGTKELMTMESARETEATLRKMLADAKAAMAAAGPVAPPPEPEKHSAPVESDVKRKEIETRIANGVAMTGEIDRLILIRTEEGRHQARARTLRDELKKTEEMIGILGPKGALRAAVSSAGAAAGFDMLASVNKVLEMMGWGTLEVSPTPSWTMRFNGVPVPDGLSAGQKLVVNIAIQAAITEAAGLRILVIDEFQTFDIDARALVTKAVRAIDNHLDQVFVLAAKADRELEGQGAPPGWKRIRVRRNGQGVSELVEE